jgi:hypothetical protein
VAIRLESIAGEAAVCLAVLKPELLADCCLLVLMLRAGAIVQHKQKASGRGTETGAAY